MKKSFLFLLLLTFSTLAIGQNVDRASHKKRSRAAYKLYEDKNYQAAAIAFQDLLENSPHELYPAQMLAACASFAHVKDEKKVRDYLNDFSKEAEKGDIDDIRELEIFEKYYSKNWWIDLDKNLDKRIEDIIKHHKSLTVFDHNRIITYSAIRISSKGDTLANTKIIVKPDGTGWGGPASDQSQAVFIYQSTIQDSLDHIQEVREIVDEKFWNNIDTTGVIENKKKIWMHPFRNNEFFKTEIAPFPLVAFPINYQTTLEQKSKIIIMRGWGTYSPSMTEEKYYYIGTESKNYSFGENILCHKYDAYGHNSVHGVSYLEYYFHEKYGFTEMNYLTYDNDVIQFKIIDIAVR